jgi:hypothetical protein
MRLKKTLTILAIVSVLLLVASYPACQYGEQLALTELAKLSPAERQRHEFDMEYVRYILPGIMMFFMGAGLGFLTVIVWVVMRVSGRRPSWDGDTPRMKAGSEE